MFINKNIEDTLKILKIYYVLTVKNTVRKISQKLIILVLLI